MEGSGRGGRHGARALPREYAINSPDIDTAGDACNRLRVRTFAQTATVTELIDLRPLSAFQLRVLLLCGVTVVLDGFDTQTIGFIAPAILAEFEAPPAAFGPVMSAALIGILIGAIVGGMLADRIGRRIIILSAAAAFGILSLLTARAASMDALILLRFLTGLGLGAALPNLVAMSNEYSPRRLKALTVVLVFAGFPLGAALGGLTSAHIAQEFGWRSIFVVGGVAPLILAILMWWLLPESCKCCCEGVTRARSSLLLST